jgi:hypothetical protein
MPHPLTSTARVRLRRGTGRSALAVMVTADLLMVSHDARAASPTLAECVAANEQAGPLEQAGSLRAARASLMQCVAPSCPAVVRDDCAKRETQLAAAIPSVVFEAKDGAGNDLSAVIVTVDGAVLATELAGNALEVDPGEHTFRFEAAGLPPVEKQLILHVAEKNRRERIVLGTVAPALEVIPIAPPHPTVHERGGAEGAGQRILGIAIAGIGVAGLAVGSAFGLEANSKWQQAQRDCSVGCGSGAPARSEAALAHQDATTANVLFPVGGAAVIAGVVLWIIAPRGRAVAAAHVTPFFTSGQGVGIAAMGSLP